MAADKVSFGEQIEIRFYKCVTLVPVIITYGVFVFLFSYYAYVSTFPLIVKFFLYPSIMGDFYGTIGIKEYWTSAEELRASQ